MVATYLETQAKTRSANAANKDRKNLLALWNWGIKRYDFPINPVIKVDKFRHDGYNNIHPLLKTFSACLWRQIVNVL
jgi:hypothetical protein